MANSEEIIFLTSLAQNWKKDVKDVLHQLIPLVPNHINIFRRFEQCGLENMNIESDNFAVLSLNTEVLHWIHTNGSWTGNTFKMPVKAIHPLEDKRIVSYADVYFNGDIIMGIEDLFVFKDAILDIEHNLIGSTKQQSEPIIEQQKKPHKPELTQEEASILAGVTIRTIYNWEKGETTPKGYPGRQSRAAFLAFVEMRESNKRFKGAARAVNRARAGGDMSEFADDEDFS